MSKREHPTKEYPKKLTIPLLSSSHARTLAIPKSNSTFAVTPKYWNTVAQFPTDSHSIDQ
jgi:hypothetical protein